MSDEKINVEELLEKAKKPAADALKLHPFYKGKMEPHSSAPSETLMILRSGIPRELPHPAGISTRIQKWSISIPARATL